MPVQLKARHMGRSTAVRRLVTGRKVTFTGYVPSAKCGRMIGYESLKNECGFIYLLEADDGVLTYNEQPEPLEWSDGERWYSTVFDFKYQRRHDHAWVLVELKPAAKVEKHGLRELYGYARAYAKRAGYADLQLWTDVLVQEPERLANAQLLALERTPYEDPAALEATRQALRRLGGQATIRGLRAASGLGVQAYRAVVKLMAHGEMVALDPTVLIDDRCVVRFAREVRQ